jgi:hypothetical protein
MRGDMQIKSLSFSICFLLISFISPLANPPKAIYFELNRFLTAQDAAILSSLSIPYHLSFMENFPIKDEISILNTLLFGSIRFFTDHYPDTSRIQLLESLRAPFSIKTYAYAPPMYFINVINEIDNLELVQIASPKFLEPEEGERINYIQKPHTLEITNQPYPFKQKHIDALNKVKNLRVTFSTDYFPDNWHIFVFKQIKGQLYFKIRDFYPSTGHIEPINATENLKKLILTANFYPSNEQINNINAMNIEKVIAFDDIPLLEDSVAKLNRLENTRVQFYFRDIPSYDQLMQFRGLTIRYDFAFGRIPWSYEVDSLNRLINPINKIK